MTAIELKKKIEEGEKFNIFDTRQKERYDAYHLPNAISIEKGMLLEKPENFMNKEEKYYITCNGGNSATMVANILRIKGFDIEALIGGMNPLLNQN